MHKDFQLNQLVSDEFGRVSGILGVNKPAGMTSHDVVDHVRRALKTQKVGHAGALDPFATGVLIVLVGKSTKDSDSFLEQDKEYIAKILFGIKTDSADIEGEVVETLATPDISALAQVLPQFTPEYQQYVSVYSSIKVEGEKLRVLARKYRHHLIDQQGEERVVRFFNEPGTILLSVNLPRHLCRIPEIGLLETGVADISNLELYQRAKQNLPGNNFPTGTIRVQCSKGTYIRVLGEDIGQALPTPTPAMLIELQRTKIGDIHLDNCLELDQVKHPS